MKKFLLLFSIVVLVGCKKEQTFTLKTATESIVKPSQLGVKINIKTNKNDVLQCVFNRIEFKNNREANYIITDKMATSQEFKSYNFKMFAENVVTLLQVKLGKTEKNVVIDNIILKYGETIITIKGNELDKYFVFNKFIEYNPENSTIKTIAIQGKHFPAMTLKKYNLNKLFNLNL